MGTQNGPRNFSSSLPAGGSLYYPGAADRRNGCTSRAAPAASTRPGAIGLARKSLVWVPRKPDKVRTAKKLLFRVGVYFRHQPKETLCTSNTTCNRLDPPGKETPGGRVKGPVADDGGRAAGVPAGICGGGHRGVPGGGAAPRPPPAPPPRRPRPGAGGYYSLPIVLLPPSLSIPLAVVFLCASC